MDEWSVHLVMDREDIGSNPGGVNCFLRVSRFMLLFLKCLFFVEQ